MKLKNILLTLPFICSCLSGAVFAEPPEGKGWKKFNESREQNSNRQSVEDSLRGLERAAERHDLKKYKEEYEHEKEKFFGRDDEDDYDKKGKKLKKEKEKYKNKKEKMKGRYDDDMDEAYKDKQSKRLEKEKRNQKRNQEEITNQGRPWWKFWSSEE